MEIFPKNEKKFLVVELSYSEQYIFPLEEGLKFVAAFASAKSFSTANPPKITDLHKKLEIFLVDENKVKEYAAENLLLGNP